MTTFIPSPNFSPGRPDGPIRWIVWHSTEGKESAGAAAALARNWFGVKASKVSAHLVADSATTIECVRPGDRAWHCGPKGNGHSYGVEVVGLAAQSHMDWRDAYSLAAIRNAADALRSIPGLDHVPAAALSDEELRAGRPGHITHAQVSRVLGGTTHTDPGPNFPMGYAVGWLQSQSVPPMPAVVNPATFPRLVYGMRNDPRVRHLQEFLVATYPTSNRYAPSGNYLDKTAAGVFAFQRANGLDGADADGRTVGPRTNAALAEHGYRP